MTLKHFIFIVIISFVITIPIFIGLTKIENKSQLCKSNGGFLVKTYEGFVCINDESLTQ